MKKIYTIFVCICLLAGFVACEKDKDFVLTTLMVQNETITPSYGSAMIDCSFKADATISEAFVQYSLSLSFAKYDVAKMTEEKGKYATQLMDLQDNTTYYIRYAVSNKYSSVVSEDVIEFQTLQCTVPTIVLDSIADVWDNRAKAHIHLTFDGGASLTDMGICWSKQANPTIEDIHKSTKDTVAVLDMTDLQENTKYYVRAYAVNKVGTAYSEEQVFTTYALPEVRTEEIDDIHVNTVLLSATLLFDGNDTATIKGFCWSDKAAPTIDANHIAVDTTSAHYTYLLPELLPATEYHVRAYAQNKIGVVYGEEKTFTTTKDVVSPTVTTATVTQITETTAMAGGNVTSDGGAEITERGVVYATTQKPTTADNKVSNGSGMGTFTCNLIDLQPNTSYYVRAYATNEVGTAYGEEVTFTTKANANISDPTGTENGYGYVDLGLSVKWATCNVGANNPEDYGDYFAWGETTTRDTYSWSTYKYCNGSDDSLTKYNTSSSYGTVDNKTQLELSDDAAHVNWGGSWRMPTDDELTELWEQCTWTWTTQNGVNGYKVTSKTNSSSIFLPATGYRYNSSLNFAGSYGYYWSSSLYTGSPYRAWSVRFHSSDVYRNDGGYRCSGLSVRPVLGESVVETTIPIVTTTLPTQITETTAVAGGNVTNDGGISVSERGVVYSLSANPSIADLNSTIVRSGNGTGAFTCNLSNLQAGTTYYVRAYAINKKGTAYGDEVSFTTALPISLATVTTASITNITETTANAGGSITNDGNAAVTERGVCIATVSNPTTSNTKITAGSGTGSFTCNLTGLQANTTYYVRAYAVNSKGTAYGEQVSFTTSKTVVLPAVTTSTVTQITQTTAVAGGNVTADGNASVTERGVCIATVSNPTTSNTKITAGSGTGSFTCNLTGLQANTTYYVRAYAVNSKGTAYGEEVSFTTQQQSNTPVTPSTDVVIIFDADIDQGNASTDTNNAAAYQITKSGVTMEVSSGIIGIFNNEAHYRIYKNQTLTLTSAVGNIVKVEFTCTANDDTKYGPGCFIVDCGMYTYSGAIGTWIGAVDAITFTAPTNQVRSTQVAVTIIDNGTENGTENGYAYVDLGLSVKWATCNVGASSSEDYGDYFAWGETEQKDDYYWDTYKWQDEDVPYAPFLTKYNTSSSNGTVDNKTQLDLSDDAARANWGGSWRMPTDEEIEELLELCTWTWTTQNGVNGYKVTSKSNSNSIFLPAAGWRENSSLYRAGSHGYYWSSSLDTETPGEAYCLDFQPDYLLWEERYCGLSVRPVCP